MLSKEQIDRLEEDTKRSTAVMVNSIFLRDLIAMLRESQKDAARYRWLRSENTNPAMIEIVSDDCNPPSVTLKCGEELDSEIDAAMQRDCDSEQHAKDSHD